MNLLEHVEASSHFRHLKNNF